MEEPSLFRSSSTETPRYRPRLLVCIASHACGLHDSRCNTDHANPFSQVLWPRNGSSFDSPPWSRHNALSFASLHARFGGHVDNHTAPATRKHFTGDRLSKQKLSLYVHGKTLSQTSSVNSSFPAGSTSKRGALIPALFTSPSTAPHRSIVVEREHRRRSSK